MVSQSSSVGYTIMDCLQKTTISPIRTVIVSHKDVCKNKFTYHLSDKTHAFGWRFIHSGGESSVILRTREHAAHVANHMIVCYK